MNTPKKSSPSVRVFYPKFDTRWVVNTLRENLPKLQSRLPVKLVALFGSYARGNYTVASDVDVLVIYEGQPRDDAYNLVIDAFPIPRLEPHVYSAEEYDQLKLTIDRMKANGISICEKSEYEKSETGVDKLLCFSRFRTKWPQKMRQVREPPVLSRCQLSC